MVRDTGVQSQVESYQRLKKWYLIPPCLALSNIRYVSRVKWSNPRKGVAPSPTPQCNSSWKGTLLVAFDYSRQLYNFYIMGNPEFCKQIPFFFLPHSLVVFFFICRSCKRIKAEKLKDRVTLESNFILWVYDYLWCGMFFWTSRNSRAHSVKPFEEHHGITPGKLQSEGPSCIFVFSGYVQQRLLLAGDTMRWQVRDSAGTCVP